MSNHRIFDDIHHKDMEVLEIHEIYEHRMFKTYGLRNGFLLWFHSPTGGSTVPRGKCISTLKAKNSIEFLIIQGFYHRKSFSFVQGTFTHHFEN